MASRYRKIDTRIHNDEKFRSLTDDGKLGFFTLLTHPHLTALGAMRATAAGLAAELGWGTRRLVAAISPLIANGMVELDEAACFLALPNFLKFNEPEGPNSVIKAWPAALQLIPECPGKHRLINRCFVYLDGTSEKFKNSIPDFVWDAFRIKDGYRHGISDGITHAKRDASPIQEQDPEQEQESPLPPKGAAAALNGLQPEGILKKWNTLPGVKPCKALDDDIRTRILTRLKEHPDPTWWDRLFQQVTASDFLCGRTNGTRGAFQATLDWVLGPKILGKVLRGNYDRVPSTAKKERLPL